MSFHIGQEVVCVDATGASMLHQGKTYIFAGCCDRTQNGLACDGVWIEGVSPGRGYSCFIPQRFRPLIKKSTEAGVGLLKEIADRTSKSYREGLVELVGD